MTNLIRKSIIIALTGASLLANTQAHADASVEESVGFGTGALIGALAGGPIGFIVGAAGGAMIGLEMHEGKEAQHAATKLEESTGYLNTRLEQQTREMKTLQSRYDALYATRDADTTSREASPLSASFDFNFRTGSSVLDTRTQEKLDQIALIMKNEPGLKAIAEGYTDKRGSEERNLQLSQARIDSVKQALVQRGIDAERFTTIAYGEAQAVYNNDDPEGQSLERRVNLSFELQQGQEQELALVEAP